MKKYLDLNKSMNRRVVIRGSVCLSGTRYFAHELCEISGRQVDVHCDDEQSDCVRVFDLKGKLICQAMEAQVSPFKPGAQGNSITQVQKRNTQNA